MEKYSAPVFLTFRQAKDEGLNIRKGASAFPVYFWKVYLRHKETREPISSEEYERLTAEQKKCYAAIPVVRYYPVFNIDQTDMPQTQPERYARLTEHRRPEDHSDGLRCEALDRLVERQEWVCPIELKYSAEAFFSPSLDRIVCPLKSQFPEGAAFYGTLLHEMTHSTGVKERLGRSFGIRPGDEKYAREELVAEFTAALCGAAAFGFTWLCSPWIVGLFLTPDAPAYAIAVQGLPWFAAGYPFFGINVVTIGYYQSIERGRLATGLTVLRGIVLMTFCFLLLPRIAGVTGIWLAVPVAEALETLLLVYLLRSRRFAFA